MSYLQRNNEQDNYLGPNNTERRLGMCDVALLQLWVKGGAWELQRCSGRRVGCGCGSSGVLGGGGGC
jgi:hypothetical protein